MNGGDEARVVEPGKRVWEEISTYKKMAIVNSEMSKREDAIHAMVC